MKTCGYCGRENEDSAVACRECGLSEFPPTPEEKAQAAEAARAIVDPEPGPPTPDVDSGEEAAICSHCLFPNHPDREWCKRCGTPFNTSVMGPFETAIARGCLYRGIVQGRPKPIIFATVWIVCFPLFLAGMIVSMIAFSYGFLPPAILAFIFSAIPGSFLFQVTRNLVTIPKPKLDE